MTRGEGSSTVATTSQIGLFIPALFAVQPQVMALCPRQQVPAILRQFATGISFVITRKKIVITNVAFPKLICIWCFARP
jgi:hypothetical protein